jgi:hypothetical protein
MRDYIKSFIVCLAAATMMAGCDVHLFHDGGHSPSGPTTVSTGYVATPSTSYVEVEVTATAYYDDACWEEPYWHEPEWCDYYDDGSAYCVWYVDGWYEEWYQWDYDSCWEYNGSWY